MVSGVRGATRAYSLNLFERTRQHTHFRGIAGPHTHPRRLWQYAPPNPSAVVAWVRLGTAHIAMWLMVSIHFSGYHSTTSYVWPNKWSFVAFIKGYSLGFVLSGLVVVLNKTIKD